MSTSKSNTVKTRFGRECLISYFKSELAKKNYIRQKHNIFNCNFLSDNTIVRLIYFSNINLIFQKMYIGSMMFLSIKPILRFKYQKLSIELMLF